MPQWIHITLPDGRRYRLPLLAAALYLARGTQGDERIAAIQSAAERLTNRQEALAVTRELPWEYVAPLLAPCDIPGEMKISPADWARLPMTADDASHPLSIDRDNVLSIPIGTLVQQMQSEGAACQMVPFKDDKDNVIAVVAIAQGTLAAPRYIAALKACSDEILAEADALAKATPPATPPN